MLRCKYQAEGVPLMIIAGKEYGSGSSRDWAAKGVLLLGVKAVIAESFERIHRSNLVGMGVLPMQFQAGQNRESLGLTGQETFSVTGNRGRRQYRQARDRHRSVRRRLREAVRGDCPDRHPRRTRILPQRRNSALCPPAGRAGRPVPARRFGVVIQRRNPTLVCTGGIPRPS